MTIGQHIGAIRGVIRQYSETEAPFSDEFIYTHFSAVAAMLTKQKYDRNKVINAFNWRYYCIGLEVGSIHGCGCIPAGCAVLKSKVRIPNPIMGRSAPFLRIMSVDHKDIGYIVPSIAGTISLDPIRKHEVHYSIVDGYLILFGANVTSIIPRAVLIGGFFEDPTAWATINACSPSTGDDTESTCFSVQNDDFPLDADLVHNAYSLTIRQMGLTLTIPEDRQNEAGNTQS